MPNVIFKSAKRVPNSTQSPWKSHEKVWMRRIRTENQSKNMALIIRQLSRFNTVFSPYYFLHLKFFSFFEWCFFVLFTNVFGWFFVRIEIRQILLSAFHTFHSRNDSLFLPIILTIYLIRIRRIEFNQFVLKKTQKVKKRKKRITQKILREFPSNYTTEKNILSTAFFLFFL